MDDKKMRITRSAIEVFQEKGIEKAKISDIVKGADVAQGTFYLYFSSKLAVMPSIANVMVEKTMKELENKVNVTTPFTEQIKQMIETIFQMTAKYREIFALIYAGMASSEHLQEWETIYETYYTKVGNLLKEAQNNGEIRENIHPKRTAVLLIGLIESAADQSYLYDRKNDQAIERKKQETLDFALHALTK